MCKIFETEIDAGTRAKRIKASMESGGQAGLKSLDCMDMTTFKGNGLVFSGEMRKAKWKDMFLERYRKEISTLSLRENTSRRNRDWMRYSLTVCVKMMK